MFTPELAIVFLSLFLFTACKNSPETKEFTYRFSMESVRNFKLDFQLNPDSTYQIEQNNFFFDKYEGVSRPVVKEGSLSKLEFEKFRELINKSNIPKMKDSYGFNESDKSDNSILYTLELIRNGESKFVVINVEAHPVFSKKFIQLIEYTNTFINANLK